MFVSVIAPHRDTGLTNTALITLLVFIVRTIADSVQGLACSLVPIDGDTNGEPYGSAKIERTGSEHVLSFCIYNTFYNLVCSGGIYFSEIKEHKINHFCIR